MVGAKQVQFMDEISTGLDSSTTYSIVKFLRDQAHALNYTTLISLLQPAPESYDLFDDVLLLSEGRDLLMALSCYQKGRRVVKTQSALSLLLAEKCCCTKFLAYTS